MGREEEGRGGRERRKGRERNKNPLQIGMVTGLHPQLQKPGKVGEFGKVGGK